MPEFHSTMFVMVLLLFASEVCLVVGWRVVAAVAKEDHSSGAQSTNPPKRLPNTGVFSKGREGGQRSVVQEAGSRPYSAAPAAELQPRRRLSCHNLDQMRT